MKLIARIAIILAFALLVVGATVTINSTRSTTMPAPPAAITQASGSATSVASDSQSATTASTTQDRQTTASSSPTATRPAGGSREQGGSQGWQSILKNVAIMALLVAAVDVVSRLVNRFRPRRPQTFPRQRLADSR